MSIFLSTQHWLDAFPAPREPHYARLCTHLAAILAADPSAPTPAAHMRATAAPAAEHVLVTHHFDDAQLRRLELELARYVGPFAKQLVRRATSQAARIEERVRILAGEIEAEGDRRQFINTCRHIEQSAR